MHYERWLGQRTSNCVFVHFNHAYGPTIGFVLPINWRPKAASVLDDNELIRREGCNPFLLVLGPVTVGSAGVQEQSGQSGQLEFFVGVERQIQFCDHLFEWGPVCGRT